MVSIPYGAGRSKACGGIRLRENERRSCLDVGDDALVLPRYSAKDIKMITKYPSLSYVAKVSINEQTMLCKIPKGNRTRAVQREYQCLHKITVAGQATLTRTPKLLGLIVDDDGGGAVGILEEFIPHEITLGQLSGGINVVSQDRRKK